MKSGSTFDLKLVCERKLPFLILEAGVNHEGSLAKAKEMIDAAAEAGADAIKFQSYKAETLASRHSPAYWDKSEEPAVSQYELFKKYDALNPVDYEVLARHCEYRNIIFCSTAFDDDFVEVLDPLMPFFKVASADLTNHLLLKKIAAKHKPVLLSVGAAYLSEIDRSVRFLREIGVEEIVLMHCVLEYPTRPEHANLRSISHLRSVYPELVIGYSDHVPPARSRFTLLEAWMLGAQVIEKHFTLDKTLPGNDHYHSMDPEDVKSLLREFVAAADMMGDVVTTCFPWERPARLQARRSLVVKLGVDRGTVIEESMLTAKRPGHGISPERVNDVIGCKTIRALDEDHVLQWSDLSTCPDRDGFTQIDNGLK